MHGTAHHASIRTCFAVHLPQRALGELRRHPEDACNDHPERSAGATDANGDGHAGDIAESNGGGKRCSESLEVADLTRVIGIGVLPPDDIDRMLEATQVDEVHPEREEHGSNDEPNDGEGQRYGIAGDDVIEEDVRDVPVDVLAPELIEGAEELIDGIEETSTFRCLRHSLLGHASFGRGFSVLCRDRRSQERRSQE